MKCLYIGHYRESGTGWSNAAIDYILALDSVGVDVVCRSIKLNNNNEELPKRILELESKSIDGVDIVIQHVLPHFTSFDSKVKNVALFVMESSSCKFSSWYKKLSLMDEIWVPNFRMSLNLELPNVKVIPHTVDLSKYDYDEFLGMYDPYNSYKFYTVIDFNKRKNLIALLRAFHSAFQPHEPVDLVIKTNAPHEQLQPLLQHIKESLKIRDLEEYKKEIIVNQRLTDEQMWQLHNTCNCYVCTSYNEAWCMPLFDAMGFGNQVLSNGIDGPLDYVPRECIVDSQTTRCFNTGDTFREIYTGYEEWEDINVPDLINKMRYQYEFGDREPGYNLDKYSYQNVGNKMKDRLCYLLES